MAIRNPGSGRVDGMMRREKIRQDQGNTVLQGDTLQCIIYSDESIQSDLSWAKL